MTSSLGIQTEGTSPSYTKRMAIVAIKKAIGSERLGVVADIGGGRGELTEILAPMCEKCFLLDFAPRADDGLSVNVASVQANLNDNWPLSDALIDFAFSLAVIEHVENPRHFFREMRRIVKPGGFFFVTTPNNHSLTSKFTFLIRGQHRLFQEASYPAHITPLLRCDLERIAGELDLEILGWFYSNHDTLPRLRWRLPFGGRFFSDSHGVLLRKAECT